MSIRPADMDPPEVSPKLWEGLGGETGWDIGANCGQSVWWMKAGCPDVLAFEPGEEAFTVLEQGYAQLPGLRLFRLAVSDTDGVICLAALPERLVKGELVTPGPYLESFGRSGGFDSLPYREVPARTADSLAVEYGFPDLVKVDTEGHEVQVLRGAPLLLREQSASWLIEFHNLVLYRECRELLECAGYTVETVRHPYYAEGSENWLGHGWIRALAPGR